MVKTQWRCWTLMILKDRGSSSVNGIHVTAGRTETGMTAERNILKLPQEGQVYMAPPKEEGRHN